MHQLHVRSHVACRVATYHRVSLSLRLIFCLFARAAGDQGVASQHNLQTQRADEHIPFLCPLPFQTLQTAIQDSRSVRRITLQALAERLGRHEHLGIRICKRCEKSEHAMRGFQEIELRASDAKRQMPRNTPCHRRSRAWGFMCSRLVRPVRKLFPLRATNCAVSLITSKSKAEMPSGSAIVYCSCKATAKLQHKHDHFPRGFAADRTAPFRAPQEPLV